MWRALWIGVGLAASAALACAPEGATEATARRTARFVVAETGDDQPAIVWDKTIVLVPRPPFDPSTYLPDFHDELRWPLSSMSHPSLEPRFAIAQAFAQPGVGWIDLCGLGAQNRHGRDKELLSYLRGWCNAIQGDVDAACTHLVPLVGSTTRGIDDAVKIDLANILADQGRADKAEHWINQHRIRDVEVLDLLAATYVEVGTPEDAARINRIAMDSDDAATVATRCARMTRQIVLVGNSTSVMLEGLRQIARPLGKMPDPTCQKLVHKLECWKANGTNDCDPYWTDVGLDPRIAHVIAAHRAWPHASSYADWLRIADSTMSIVGVEGAAAFALGAIDNAIRTARTCEHARDWLTSNAVTFHAALTNAPELSAQFQRLLAECH